jgi:putative oxidoreductase
MRPEICSCLDEGGTMRYVVFLGRLLFSTIFIVAGLGHFTQAEIGMAAQQGVPLPSLLVPAAGVLALVGGVSILVGYHTRIGAGLLVLFLVPVTLVMHNFWALKDPVMAQMQQAHFMKNMSLLGSALIVSYFGAGPLSLDARWPTPLSERRHYRRAA